LNFSLVSFGSHFFHLWVWLKLQSNPVKTNFREPTKISSHYQQFFLSGYDNTCTILQQTKQV
jgi:hypothetical protein